MKSLAPEPLVESIEVSTYAFVLMTKLLILTDEGVWNVVLAILRGERG